MRTEKNHIPLNCIMFCVIFTTGHYSIKLGRHVHMLVPITTND